jgi:acetylornithine deacetylase
MMKKDIPDLSRIISETVDRRKNEIIDFCRDLIRIPSLTGGERRIQEFVARHLKDMGLEVKVWEPDLSKMKGHPGYVDLGKDYVNRPNVVGIYKGKGGRSLILNGHTDVVTPEPLKKWSHDPWGGEICRGKIYGRGACDMKGGITGMIKALQILLELDLAPLGDVTLEVVVDEEASGNGTLASVLEGYSADAAIFAEPTSCVIMPAHRGAFFWRVYIEGKGAHAGVKYQGISAVEKGMLIYRALEGLENKRNEIGKKHPLYSDYPLVTPLCVGKFNGGQYPSSVPEECILEGTIEFLPGEKAKEVRAEFEQTIETTSRKDSWLKNHPPKIEWFGLNFPPAQISSDHSLIKSVKSAYTKISGKQAKIVGLPAGCDMRNRVLYAKTPSIVFGPGDISLAHRVDESIDIEELLLFTKILALGMLEWSQKENYIL